MTAMEPDGYLSMTVREIQLDVDGSAFVERAQPYRYDFKNVRFWKQTPHGLLIALKDGDVICYPWNMIEQYYVRVNSPEYVEWVRQTKPNGDPTHTRTREMY